MQVDGRLPFTLRPSHRRFHQDPQSASSNDLSMFIALVYCFAVPRHSRRLCKIWDEREVLGVQATLRFSRLQTVSSVPLYIVELALVGMSCNQKCQQLAP